MTNVSTEGRRDIKEPQRRTSPNVYNEEQSYFHHISEEMIQVALSHFTPEDRLYTYGNIYRMLEQSAISSISVKRKSKTFHWDLDDPLFQVSSEVANTITDLCFKIDLTNLHTQLQRAATIAKKCKQLKVLMFTQMNLDNQIISYPHGPRLIRCLQRHP